MFVTDQDKREGANQNMVCVEKLSTQRGKQGLTSSLGNSLQLLFESINIIFALTIYWLYLHQ